MELAEIMFFAPGLLLCPKLSYSATTSKGTLGKNMKRTLERLVLLSQYKISICALSRNLIWHTRQIYASDNIVLRDPKTCPLLALKMVFFFSQVSSSPIKKVLRESNEISIFNSAFLSKEFGPFLHTFFQRS